MCVFIYYSTCIYELYTKMQGMVLFEVNKIPDCYSTNN